MIAISALVLAAVTAAPHQTELVVFSAPWCGHCRTMEPVLNRLQAGGLPLRQVDIDREPDLAKQFQVSGVPCFVMLAEGREVDRVLGAATYDRLLRMFQAARPGNTGALAAQIPPAATQSFAAATQALPAALQAPAAVTQALPAAAPVAPAAVSLADLVRRALAATVRLRVDDAQGNSYGTGTIVHVYGDEALVLTCGHIFRDSAGRGTIQVDFSHPQAAAPVAGHLIGYDLENDVALVSIRPGVAIEPLPVASPGHKVRPGDRVFSIGCDKGDRPSVRHSEVSAVDKFLGPPNVVVRGAPVDGRSGGGLFSADGHLIGVCNAADKAENEGLYAAAAAAYGQFDKANLAFVYRGNQAPAAAVAAAPQVPAPRSGASPSPFSAEAVALHDLPPLTAVSTRGTEALAAPAATPPSRLPEVPSAAPGAAKDSSELICIVRSRDPRQTAQVIVVPQPSRALLDSLAREQGQLPGGDLTSLRTFAGSSPVPPAALTAPAAAQPIVVRGQSLK